MVSGVMVQVAAVATGGERVPHELAKRVSFGADGGRLGIGSPQPGRDRSNRRGRSAMAKGPPLPDARVPDRRPLPAVAAHRAGTNGAQSAEFLPHAGKDT